MVSPEQVYGYVVGRFLLSVGDRAGDPDAYPDTVAAVGTVTFKPVTTSILATPPATVFPQPIVCVVDPNTGNIVDNQGLPGVWLVAGQYDVSFAFGSGVILQPFRINVTADNTSAAPVDLSLAAPTSPSPAVVFVVNQQVYNDTLAARDAAAASAASAAASVSAAGSVRAWAPNTSYVAGQVVVSPSGDLVTSATAHTSGAAYSGLVSAGGNWNRPTDVLYGKDVRAWAPNTSYAAGQAVVSPTGDLVRAKVAFTSSAAYSSADWSTTGSTTISAAANGVIGDGVADDAPALNTILSSAAAFGASVTLAPGSTVLAKTATISVPSGTRLDLNGATIKSALPGIGDRLLTISGKSNVHVYNGTLDGNTAGWAGGTTEQRHNVFISNSSNITLRKIVSKNAHGDGIYVGDQTGASTDIYLERVICDGNWRNGMSISHVSGLIAVGSKFRNSSGTSPQAGVDIEPNVGSVVCEDIHFVGCTFTGNQLFGFLVSFNFAQTAHQGNIDAIGCTFSGNGLHGTGGGGVFLAGATDVTITGGASRANTGPGVLIGSTLTSSNLKLEGTTIESNSTHGVYVSQAVVGLDILSNDIRNNGTAASATYDGLSLTPAGASSSIRLVGNRSTGSGQRYGLNTSSTITGLVSIGNDFAGNGTASQTLSDDATTRTQIDAGAGSLSQRVVWWSGTAATLQSFRLTGDTSDRLAILTDGRVLWGPGNAAGDAQLSRVAAGVVGTGAAQAFRPGVAATASRPSAVAVGKGSMFYDSTLSKPIWSDGTNWKDATGATV